MNKQGQTILIVTHDMTLSKKVRRVIAIRDGKISSERILKEAYQDRVKESNIDWRMEETQDEYAILDKANRVQLPAELPEQLALPDNKVKIEVRGNELVITKPEES